MKIQLNGESREVAGPITLAELLRELGIQKATVAVEVNRAVVPRSRHESVTLSAGDEIEIVSFTGGG